MESVCQVFSQWCEMLMLVCGVLLLKLVDMLVEYCEVLVQLESFCFGKIIMLVWMFELDQLVVFLCYFVGWVGKVIGEMLDVLLLLMVGEKYIVFICCQLLGVVVGIVLWNFFIMIVIWKLVVVLVCGCIIVFKLSEYMLLMLLCVVELVKVVGILDGVINVVNGVGGEIV